MQVSTSNQEIFFSQARELFEQMVSWLSSDTVCGLEHSQLENQLLEQGYELLRRLFQGYLDRRKDDEIEGECDARDEQKRTHKKKLSRKLTTIFGTVIVNRIGYGGRKMTSLMPLDGELNLPTSQYSHGLSQRVAQEVARSGFSETVAIIEKNTAAKVGKRQVEELAQKSGEDFEEFYTQQKAQSEQLGETGEIVVMSVDGKGVVMRKEDLRPDTQKRAINSSKKLNKRLTKGEKRNSKRMATVASVYTINPFVRKPEQIVNPEQNKEEDGKLNRPKAIGKRVWASLEREPVDVCARYLLNNSAYLKYDQYLEAGLPIATGVIEGACRHLIKDRMDITGARWSLKGAEAVLKLRSLYISGDWHEYWGFHLKQEQKRNHSCLYVDGIPLMKQVIQARCSLNPAQKVVSF